MCLFVVILLYSSLICCDLEISTHSFTSTLQFNFWMLLIVAMHDTICLLVDSNYYFWYWRELAAESIYKERCIAVDDGLSWAKYMSISGSPDDEHDIITLQYTEEGLLTIDENREGHAAAFGDDIAIECLATEFKREIYVVRRIFNPFHWICCFLLFFGWKPLVVLSFLTLIRKMLECIEKGSATPSFQLRWTVYKFQYVIVTSLVRNVSHNPWAESVRGTYHYGWLMSKCLFWRLVLIILGHAYFHLSVVTLVVFSTESGILEKDYQLFGVSFRQIPLCTVLPVHVI